MPVTGRNIEYRKPEYMPEFSREQDYFAIGEAFQYNPMNFKDFAPNFKDFSPILVMPVKDCDPETTTPDCANNCALYQFCSSIDICNNGLSCVPVPNCLATSREDGNNVYFVEV